MSTPSRWIPTLLALALASPQLAAQATGPVVSGQVRDLVRAPDGGLYYVTATRLGHLATDGTETILASSGFGNGAVGAAVTASGEIAVVDLDGNIYLVPQSGGAPDLVYADLYLINVATDLAVDADGTFLIPCRTPSNGVRGIACVDVSVGFDPSSRDWSFWMVDLAHQPQALAADGASDAFLITDGAGAVGLHAVDIEGERGLQPVPAPLDPATFFSATPTAYDGDLAVEADGDAWLVSGNTLWFHDRFQGTTVAFQTTSGQVRRAAAIADSSTSSSSVTGHSLWVAQSSPSGSTTQLLEWIDVDPPASDFAPSIGGVPSEGLPIGLSPIGVNIVSLEADLDGGLLYGGDEFGIQAEVRRLDPETGQTTSVANIPGPDGRVEGIEQGPDGTIHVLTQDGRVYAATANPNAPTLLFSDPTNAIAQNISGGASTKGLAIDRAGDFYIAERSGFSFGQVARVTAQTGQVDVLAPTNDSRGIAGDPFAPAILATEWNNTGYDSAITRVDIDLGTLVDLPYATGINISNGSVWGDGDVAVDSAGHVYTVAEDEFAVWQFDRYTGRRTRIGSGYGNFPGGVTIAPSRSTTSSASGWSLWVHHRFEVFEIPDVPAPAPRWVDLDEPPIGSPFASIPPQYGEPRGLVHVPSTGNLAVVMADGYLLEAAEGGNATVVAGPSQGLGSDLSALAAAGDGTLWIGASDGRVWQVEPQNGWQTSLQFDDAADQLESVCGLGLSADGRLWALDRPAGANGAGRLFTLTLGGSATLEAWTARGGDLTQDPLSGDLFVSQQGPLAHDLGEVLRVEVDADPVRTGHWRPSDLSAPRGHAFGERGGSVAISTDGHVYLGVSTEGRIVRLDRGTGTESTLSGNYADPIDVELAPGTPGVAGSRGSSLFVLDGHAIYEHGVDDAHAAPQTTPSGLARLDTAIDGLADFGGSTDLSLRAPAHPNALYVVFPGFFGKQDGFPLNLIGVPNDPRSLPTDYDPLFWTSQTSPSFSLFIGTLDGQGEAPAGTGILLPSTPSVTQLEAFLDLHWIVLDPTAASFVRYISSTAHLYVGDG